MTQHPTEFKYLFRQLNSIVWASPPQAMKSELDGIITVPSKVRVERISKTLAEAKRRLDAASAERGYQWIGVEEWNDAEKWFIKHLEGIIVDKTEGQSASRVKVAEGHGLLAYFLVYQWFTQVTGSMLQEEFRKIISPSPLGKEDQMFMQLEEWEKAVDKITKYGDEFKLTANVKINALEALMSNKKEYFEQVLRMRESANTDGCREKLFNELLQDIKAHAFKKRGEAISKSSHATPMDLGIIEEGTEEDHNHHWSNVEALSKGKGKGKGGGKKGSLGGCAICGDMDHWKDECPYNTKGKNKGAFGKRVQRKSRVQRISTSSSILRESLASNA